MTEQTVLIVMLGAAAAGIYFVGRMVFGAMAACFDSPLSRAVVCSSMVLFMAITLCVAGRPVVGIHLPIACALAAMTFGVACILTGRRPTERSTVNRGWAWVMPAGLLTLLAGAGGRMDFLSLGVLAGFGVIALAMWDKKSDAELPKESDEPRPSGIGFEPRLESTMMETKTDGEVAGQIARQKTVPEKSQSAFAAIGIWAGGLVFCVVAALLVVKGLPGLEAVRRTPADLLACSFLLAPAIMVPMFFELLPPCRSLGWTGSISALMKFSIVSLCLVLPSVVLAEAYWPGSGLNDVFTATGFFSPATTLTSAPATLPVISNAKIIFAEIPPLALRIDVVALLAASLLLLRSGGDGSARPGVFEALILMLCYLGALVMGLISTAR